jgi:hypothetical protein
MCFSPYGVKGMVGVVYMDMFNFLFDSIEEGAFLNLPVGI